MQSAFLGSDGGTDDDDRRNSGKINISREARARVASPLCPPRGLCESLARSSQATRSCTGSREKVHAALRECRRHVQGVPLRRNRRFARQERCSPSLFLSLLSRVCASSFFRIPISSRNHRRASFLLLMIARLLRLARSRHRGSETLSRIA